MDPRLELESPSEIPRLVFWSHTFELSEKVRKRPGAAAEIDSRRLLRLAREAENAARFTEGQEIVVPGKLVNRVVRPAG